MKDYKLIGKLLLIFGLIGLSVKLMEPIIITKGCFGYDYTYEVISFGVPIIFIIIGFKMIKK